MIIRDRIWLFISFLETVSLGIDLSRHHFGDCAVSASIGMYAFLMSVRRAE